MPIYSDSPDALVDARGDLRGADSFAALPAWLNDYRPLAADLRAQATTGKSRPLRRWVALKVVLLDESAPGRDRLGQVIMEQVAGETATGELYAADTMAGVITDDAWRGALDAALGYARECEFGIVPGTDVRWSVRVLQPGEKWEDWEDTDENKPHPLKAGQSITGRSAGVAFFLGLFALAQGEGAASGWKAADVVQSIVALATLPETETRASVDPLGTLGGVEKRKLEALRNLPENSGLVVVFPSAFAGTIHGKHESLRVTTVGGLLAALRERCGATSRPDSLPVTRGAISYIGGEKEVEGMKQAFSEGGWHVVIGTGGVGKTARVMEASAPLWNEGLFRGGRFWIDFYGARETGRAADIVAAGAIVTAWGRKREEKLEDLRTQARDLLGLHRSLVLLEGAETVPECEITALLELFPSRATVVWMTRREDDAQHPSLRRAVLHPIQALGPAHALELLCHAAGREVVELPLAERPAWEEIAEATQRLPLLLGWAGEALRPDWGTSAFDYLAELYADPLAVIAEPRDREMHNAGRFLRRSLARITPTAEMPDLPAVAERLFAGLAAFDPSYGAPLAWWPLAAGLDTSKAPGQRRFFEARRRLLGLGLVTRQVPPAGAKAIGGTVHAVHALAGTVATDMWREQAPPQRAAVLGVLCQAATAALKAPLPPDWFRDVSWIAGRTAEATYYGHWVGEMEALASERQSTGPWAEASGITVNSSAADGLGVAWVEFLQEYAGPQPLLALKEAAWTAVCRHYKLPFAIRPDSAHFQLVLSRYLCALGDVRAERLDWAGAEDAYKQAMVPVKKLSDEHPDVLDYQEGLAVARVRLGRVSNARQDLAGAEIAFKEAISIYKRLADEHPDAVDFQSDLSDLWNSLGDVRRSRADREGAETAFKHAMAIIMKLVEENPDVPSFQAGLAVSWDRLGKVSEERKDWAGAEIAFNQATAIYKRLATAHPDSAHFQRELSASFGRLGEFRELRLDWAGAEDAYKQAMVPVIKLADEHPDVPDFQEGLGVAWTRLGKVSEAREDLAGAETAFKEAIAIDKRLADAHPEVARFQNALSVSWIHLGNICFAQQEWVDAGTAFQEAVAIDKRRADAHPAVVGFQRELSVSWQKLGRVHGELRDWDGAKRALNEALSIAKTLVQAHPDSADFQHVLAVTWERLATIAEESGDDAAAEQALRELLSVSDTLISRWPGVSVFEETATIAMLRLARLLERRGCTEEAATLNRGGLARVEQLASLLQVTGAKPTIQQKQIIAILPRSDEPETDAVAQ